MSQNTASPKAASPKPCWSLPFPRSCSRPKRIQAGLRSKCSTDFARCWLRPGAKALQGTIQNWWRQGMMGGALAHYEGIKAFSEVDQTDDLKAIAAPTLVLQGDDDQVVPYKDASLLQAKLLKHGTLKIYPGFPHGMMTTHADVINADLLAFIRS